MARMRVPIVLLATLVSIAPVRASAGEPKSDARRHLAQADKLLKAGDTAVAIDTYWQALAAATRIDDAEERYATANVIRLRIAETELAAHAKDGDPRHLDAATTVLDEYVKVHNPADPERAQALYGEIDRRRHPAPAPRPAPVATPPRDRAPTPSPPRPPSKSARPMTIAGATLVAIGGASAIGMIAALVVSNEAEKDIDAATTDDALRRADKRHDGSRTAAIATGVVAAATLAAGVPLLVIGIQRGKGVCARPTMSFGTRHFAIGLTASF